MLEWFKSFGRAEPIVFAFRNRSPKWDPRVVQALIRENGAFQETIKDCSRVVENRLGWSVDELLSRPAEELGDQLPQHQYEPTLTAVQIAEVEAWRARGVTPSAVLGVCAGEPAAAYTAGVLTLEEAMRIACAISGHAAEAMELPSKGGGFGAQLTFEQGLRLQEATNGGVFAAFEWDVKRTLFTGQKAAIDKVLPELEARGIRYTPMAFEGFAAHSPLLDSLRPAFVERLEGLVGQTPTVPVYSGRRGGRLVDCRFDGAHFWDVITDPVLVARMVREVLEDGYSQFLEVSLSPDLVFPVESISGRLGIPATLKSSLESLSNDELPFEPARPSLIGRALRFGS
jgi:acyl transferase domain-containing protein